MNKKDKIENIKNLTASKKDNMMTASEIALIEERNLDLASPVIIYDKETDEVQKILRSIAEKAGLDIINVRYGK